MRRCQARASRFSVEPAALIGLAGALLCGAPACGPIEYMANTPFEAAGAVNEAKHGKAERYAPYEVTAAQEYLHKSRELAGYARFQDSVEFARKATKLAREATTIAKERASIPEATGAIGDTNTGGRIAPVIEQPVLSPSPPSPPPPPPAAPSASPPAPGEAPTTPPGGAR